MNAWNSGTSSSAGSNPVTILEGSSFCISAETGDMAAHMAQGVFYRDTRILSFWQLVVAGSEIDTLDAQTPEPYQAVFVGRVRDPGCTVESTLVLRRERYVGAGLREVLTLFNYGSEPVTLDVRLLVDSDFADLFDVKVGVFGPDGEVERQVHDDGLLLSAVRGGTTRGVWVHGLDSQVLPDGLQFRAEVNPRQSWSTSVIATPLIDGRRPADEFLQTSPPGQMIGAQRMASWERGLPRLTVQNQDVQRVLERSHEDLGSLRIVPGHPGRTVIAAGAPWFMALFGRDALLTGLMSLPLDASLALGTLQTLAERQGDKVDPLTEEEPGRILHEVRHGASAALALGGRHRLLRHRRRHTPVRRAAGGTEPLDARRRTHRRPAAAR